MTALSNAARAAGRAVAARPLPRPASAASPRRVHSLASSATSLKSQAQELLQLVDEAQAKDTLSETQLEACYASIERLSDAMLRTVNPLQYTVSLAESHCQAIALHLVNEWKVADLLGDEALSIDDIAARATLRPPFLQNMMTSVHHRGYFDRDADGRYRNNDLSALLRSGHPQSVQQAVSFIGDDGLRASTSLGQASRATETATAYQFAFQTDKDYFAHVAQPENRARETRMGVAMKELHRSLPNAFATEYDWHALGEGPLVDVGGGQGTSPLQLHTRYPSLRFVLFDRPTTIARAREVLAPHIDDARIAFADGDFFEHDPRTSGIPTGQPFYLLRNVLHDWDAEQCIAILRNVRAAMLHGASPQAAPPTLLISDLNLSPTTSSFCYTTSTQVLALGGGMERTPEDYRRLLADAGFEATHEHSLGIDSILAARPLLSA